MIMMLVVFVIAKWRCYSGLGVHSKKPGKLKISWAFWWLFYLTFTG